MYVHNFSDGHMILGCSNLTGRFWIGSLWYYRSPDEGPSVEKALTGVDFDNGLVDGFFINNKNVRNINSIYSIHSAYCTKISYFVNLILMHLIDKIYNCTNRSSQVYPYKIE